MLRSGGRRWELVRYRPDVTDGPLVGGMVDRGGDYLVISGGIRGRVAFALIIRRKR